MRHKELEKTLQEAFTRTIKLAKERAAGGYFTVTVDVTEECENIQNFDHEFFVYMAKKGFLVSRNEVPTVLSIDFSDKSWYNRTDVIRELNQLAHQKDIRLSDTELRDLYLEWLGQIQEARKNKYTRLVINVREIHGEDKKQLKSWLSRNGFNYVEIDELLRVTWANLQEGQFVTGVKF